MLTITWTLAANGRLSANWSVRGGPNSEGSGDSHTLGPTTRRLRDALVLSRGFSRRRTGQSRMHSRLAA